MTIDLDDIRARAEAATPGPWEVGHVWLTAGVLAKRFGNGKCCYCHLSEPVWTGSLDINGTTMPAHRHRNPNPYGDGAISAAGGETVASDGILDPADVEFIAAARTDVPALLARVNEQATEIERLREAIKAGAELADNALRQLHTNPLHTGLALDLRNALAKTVKSEAQPAEPQYLIWSQHHKAWWGPDGSGYRNHIADAGKYALADTPQWLSRGCGCCLTPEVVVLAPPLVMYADPKALDRFVNKQIKTATATRIAAGQTNRYASTEPTR